MARVLASGGRQGTRSTPYPCEDPAMPAPVVPPVLREPVLVARPAFIFVPAAVIALAVALATDAGVSAGPWCAAHAYSRRGLFFGCDNRLCCGALYSDSALLPTPFSRDSEVGGHLVTGEVSRSMIARESTLSTIFLQALNESLARTGVPMDRLLRGSVLENSSLDVEAGRISRTEFFRLWELAMELTGDSALSLHCIESLEARTTVSHLIAHASCLGHALESLFQYQGLLSDDPILQRLEGEQTASLRVLPLAEQTLTVRRLWAELLMSSLFRLLRRFEPGAQPERVSFEFAAPPYSYEYMRIFGSGVRFEQLYTEIVIDRALLAAQAPERDEELHKAVQELAERQVMRLTHSTPYATRVSQFLSQHARPYQIEMQTVANALGLSVRSLRRRLAIEGHSYNKVVSETLAAIAKRLLSNRRYTIQEVAYEMGFTDTTAFHHAFRRWTATTASSYRRGLLQRAMPRAR